MSNPIVTMPRSNRPEFRVAMFGVSESLQHVLEVVARHAQHNPYGFHLAASRSADAFDIAIVDMSIAGGPEVAGTLNNLLNGRPIVRLGRRSDKARGCDDVVHERFARQVLDVLNGQVQQHFEGTGRMSGTGAMPWVAAQAMARGPLGGSEAKAVNPNRPRALIVDDSPTVRHQLTVALQQMGLESDAVDSANDALQLLMARRYDMVFADVVMPGQDGYQLTRDIRRSRLLKGVPVVILTSRSSPFDLVRGALAGCSSYLVKPVSLHSLRDTVNRQLRRSAPARPRPDTPMLRVA